MDAAYKAGVNFFDCAEGYAEGKQQCTATDRAIVLLICSCSR